MVPLGIPTRNSAEKMAWPLLKLSVQGRSWNGFADALFRVGCSKSKRVQFMLEPLANAMIRFFCEKRG
jgi:hypothetical protein